MKAIVHPNICLLTPPANRLVQYIFQNFEGPFAFSVKTSAFKPLAAQLTHPDFTLQNLRAALDALTQPQIVYANPPGEGASAPATSSEDIAFGDSCSDPKKFVQ